MSLPKTYVPTFHNEDRLRAVLKHYSYLGKTDMQVFRISLGTATFGSNVDFDERGIPYGAEFEKRRSAVTEALLSGVNLIDTAPLYCSGCSERVLGEVLKNIPRNSFYLSTKVGRNHDCKFDYSAKGVRESFAKSLANLLVDYIDLVTIHDVEFLDDPNLIISEVLPVLEELKREGKLKYIGISGYPLDPLEKIFDQNSEKISYVITYCRLSLFNDDLLRHRLINKSSIGIINAAYLGMGLLTPYVSKSPPLPYWHPALHVPELVQACRNAATICEEEDLCLPRLAANYALSLRQDRVSTHLVGMNSPQEVETALFVLKEDLNKKEKDNLQIIRKLFVACSKTHWEEIELGAFRKDIKAFEENLRLGPRC